MGQNNPLLPNSLQRRTMGTWMEALRGLLEFGQSEVAECVEAPFGDPAASAGSRETQGD